MRKSVCVCVCAYTGSCVNTRRHGMAPRWQETKYHLCIRTCVCMHVLARMCTHMRTLAHQRARAQIYHISDSEQDKNFAFKCHRDQAPSQVCACTRIRARAYTWDIYAVNSLPQAVWHVAHTCKHALTRAHTRACTHTQDIYAVNAICFHKQHGTFCTAGSDGTFNFWDKDAKQRLKNFSKLQVCGVGCLVCGVWCVVWCAWCKFHAMFAGACGCSVYVPGVSLSICMYACMHACVCVCVCERERERERECVCVYERGACLNQLQKSQRANSS